ERAAQFRAEGPASGLGRGGASRGRARGLGRGQAHTEKTHIGGKRMARFLNPADWQIGRQYGQFSADDAPFLVEERFRAVERIAALATEQAVDAVLVAGDVFDTQTVEERTIRRLFNAMRGFDGLWLMIPGNHDAALAESVWQRAQRLQVMPPNVQVFLQPGVHGFPDHGFAVLAAPLTQRHTYNDLT